MLLEDLLKEERKAAEVKIAQGFILDILEKLGNSSEKLHDRIMSETNINTLKHMHKFAVKADTLEEFDELISSL